MAVSLGELAVRFGCELRGDPDTQVERVATLGNADARSLSFLANPRYRAQLIDTRAAAVVLECGGGGCLPRRRCWWPPTPTQPMRASLTCSIRAPRAPGCTRARVVAQSAHIDPTAQVAALAVIGEHVVIGPRTFVGPHSILDAGVVLEADVRLVARVTLGPNVQIGARTVLQPGAVVGAEGFGFAPETRRVAQGAAGWHRARRRGCRDRRQHHHRSRRHRGHGDRGGRQSSTISS